MLLSISATWCHWCHEMDRTSYSDPAVVSLINDRFVPVRVDADERPDINERYNLGGWPTTAFLTPEGDVICGGTYVPVERMAALLDQVARAFAERSAEIAERALGQDSGQASRRRDEHEAGSSTTAVDELSHLVFSHFDREFGGFGTEPKFPHAAPVHLALDLFRESGDETMRDVVVKTLDAMGWGGLFDEIDGGFFRYASTRAWQLPHFEKLLSVNAAMLPLYVTAADVLQLARFRERAEDVLRYIQTWLADTVDGGWFASQRADPEYFGASRDDRRARKAPPVDERLYTDGNGTMVSAALHAARAADDEGLRQFAIKSLERVVLASYRPGEGVAHWFDGEPHVRGLLEDQIAMAAAHLDAYEATGNIVYEMMAEELVHYALRTMWDDAGGGFFDRASADEVPDAPAIGLLRQRIKPFVANCDAATVLRRVAATSGEHDFAARSDAALEAIAPLAAAQGPLAAHYVLAVRRARQR